MAIGRHNPLSVDGAAGSDMRRGRYVSAIRQKDDKPDIHPFRSLAELMSVSTDGLLTTRLSVMMTGLLTG